MQTEHKWTRKKLCGIKRAVSIFLFAEQTCKSDELFHEIGIVRLQPEVMSCAEWIALAALVWDGMLVADVVVWLMGNDAEPILATILEKYLWKIL